MAVLVKLIDRLLDMYLRPFEYKYKFSVSLVHIHFVIMLDLTLDKYEITLSNDPVLAVCRRCSMAFTRPALFSHMKTHEGFREPQDLFQLILERARVVRVFSAPPHPVPPIPGVTIAIGELCSSPGCTAFFSDTEELTSHARSHSAKDVVPQEAFCHFQEVQEDDNRCIRFRIICEELNSEGDYIFLCVRLRFSSIYCSRFRCLWHTVHRFQ